MEKSCSECSEPTFAQSLCTLCNKWLCYQCTNMHQHQSASFTSQYTDLHPQQRTSASQCPDLQQKGSSSLLPSRQGPGSYPCSLLVCHSHEEEPLELFCESCDLLCCSSCHLSSHKNHRVVQTGEALQDQQWLFESLMVQVEKKRSAVENSAKQIEDRLHGVKIAHRKAENQIKMAKMIMMNELNKRANLLIEQLEKISEDFQQHLEDQLQGAIETCGQLDHVQKFITWAVTHHCRGPILFSRTLISFQVQELLNQSLHSGSWNPLKIKLNWNASYWTKQISTFGQLTVEGGNCTHPPGLACSSILRSQPVACLALSSVCHRRRESGCGYQACCEPQMCCLHGPPSQADLSCLDKKQLETTICKSSCVQPAHIAGTLHQNQQHQRCLDPQSLSQCPPSSSPVPLLGPIQHNCSQGPTSLQQASVSQPQSLTKSYLYHQNQRERESLAQGIPDPRSPRHYQGKLPSSTPPQQDLTAVDRDVMTEEIWVERYSVEETHGQTCPYEFLDEELQQDRREQSPVEQQQHHPSPAAELRKERQRIRHALMVRDHRDGKRSTSQEVSVTTQDCIPDGQSSRISPSLACMRSKRSSLSIPAEMATPSTSPYSGRPTECTYICETGSANKNTNMHPRQRRASDGLLCVVKETSSDMLPSQGYPCPLLSYKTETDHSLSNANEKNDQDTKKKCRVSRSGDKSITDVQKDSRRTRVPVVCLERLKILVSQHERRGSDPLPASRTVRNEAFPPQRTWHIAAPENFSALDLDSDPKSTSEGDVGTLWAESLTEGELVCLDEEKSAAAGEVECCAKTDSAGDLEPSLEYEPDPESDPGAGSENGQGMESGDVERESDFQSEYEPTFQPETDSDIVSDQPLDSQGSAETELNVESELCSDLEEDPNIGPGQRPLLIDNPITQPDNSEMESEDFCAVCLIGGDLLCCDLCPKVFHLSCHIPPLLSFPSGDWVCSLCRNIAQPEVAYDCENEKVSGEHTGTPGLSACDQRKCEQLTLLILSNILSAPFHEPVSPQARHYYQIIKRPMDLSMIRGKLNNRNSQHYNSTEQFVTDVFLMFRNCAKFNYPDSEVAQAGRSLEAFFISKLKEVFPDRVFPVAETDSDSDEYDDAYRAAGGWTERREQCHRKRKRRNSLKSRRHQF